MPPKPQSVSTAADELYELVLKEKEISFKDAAQRLKVPIATIEAWATFLEEDGTLSIKYKLTTPFLTTPSQKSEKKNSSIISNFGKDKMFLYKVETAEVKSDFEKTFELLDTASEKVSEGEFGVLGRVESQMLEKLKKIVDFLMSSAQLSPQRKAELNKELAEIQKSVESASELTMQQKFDEANSKFSLAHSSMRKLLEKTRKEFSEGTETADVDEKNLKKLFEATYDSLEQGKVEEAQENYEKIRRMFSVFSSKFSAEKSDLQDSIIKLNRDLALKTAKVHEQRLVEGVQKISGLIMLANQSLAKKQFNSATAYYFEIKKIFEILPSGFTKEKRKLKESILKVFERIAKEREYKLKARFMTLSKQITELLNEADKQIAAGKLDSALSSYKSVSRFYADLPIGFMREKFGLHRRIISVYNIISQRIEVSAESFMTSKTSAVIELLNQMRQQIRENRLDEASATYSMVNKTFLQIPEGFMEKKTELQEKIIDLYEELLEKSDNRKATTFEGAVREIGQMIAEGETAVKASDYVQAYTLYKRIKKAYIQLQPINIKQRQEIRNRILGLYRNVLILRNRQESSNLKIPQLNRSVTVQSNKNIHRKIGDLKSMSKAQVRFPTLSTD